MVLPRVNAALVEYALRSSMAEFVPPEAHDMVIAVSLNLGDRAGLPAETGELIGFAEGPLSDAVTQLFGGDAARAVVLELRACLDGPLAQSDDSGLNHGRAQDDDAAAHSQWSRKPSLGFPAHQQVSYDRDTVQSPESYGYPELAEDTSQLSQPVQASVVFVADQGTESRALQRALGAGVKWVEVPTMTSVYSALEKSGEQTLVLLDARSRLDVVPLIDLAEHPTAARKVVIWGGQASAPTPVKLVAPAHWVHLGESAEPEDVAAVVTALLGS